jgi:hypothetical protein
LSAALHGQRGEVVGDDDDDDEGGGGKKSRETTERTWLWRELGGGQNQQNSSTGATAEILIAVELLVINAGNRTLLIITKESSKLELKSIDLLHLCVCVQCAVCSSSSSSSSNFTNFSTLCGFLTHQVHHQIKVAHCKQIIFQTQKIIIIIKFLLPSSSSSS